MHLLAYISFLGMFYILRKGTSRKHFYLILTPVNPTFI